MEKEPKTLALEVAKLLRDKRAEELLVLDIEHLTVLASYMVVCSGRSTIQVKAMADELEEKLPEQQPIRREGYAEGRWIVLDYGSVLVDGRHEPGGSARRINLKRTANPGKRRDVFRDLFCGLRTKGA